MQALVLNDDRKAQAATAMALFKRNFQVVTADDVEIGAAYANLGVFDLVVMAERVQGRLSHSVALAAELRNPEVTTMVLTPRVDEDVDELYELLPSLYCLLGDKLEPETVARMAVAGVVGQFAVADRARGSELSARAAARLAVDAAEDWTDEDWTEVAEADGVAAGEADGKPLQVDPAAALTQWSDEYSPVMAEIIARATASMGQGRTEGRDTGAKRPAGEGLAA
ncbi:MAG: hypothetical protein R3D85_07785 [Paracoccaceae bacterium]